MKKTRNFSRRRFVKTGIALPIAGPLAAAATPAMRQPAEIYKRLGVKTFINAYGTLTTLSGTLMPAEVVQAMAQASQNFVAIHELQEKVGQRLAELTGAEAAFVTSGASAALCLAACAVTAGDDPEKKIGRAHV